MPHLTLSIPAGGQNRHYEFLSSDGEAGTHGRADDNPCLLSTEHFLHARPHAKCFRCSVPFKPIHFFHFTNEFAEAQQSGATCPRPHSWYAVLSFDRAMLSFLIMSLFSEPYAREVQIS